MQVSFLKKISNVYNIIFTLDKKIYNDEQELNNGEEVMGEKVTKGAIVIQNNLVVEVK